MLALTKIGVVVALFSTSIIQEAKADYCTDKFGKYAYLTFEPSSANGKAVEDSIFGSRDVSNPNRPEPKAFRCGLDDFDNKQKLCPKGMHRWPGKAADKCTTSKLNLRELCGSEYLNNWPKLKTKTCAKRD